MRERERERDLSLSSNIQIDINFTYQHRHNKRGPEFIVGNHFESSLFPDKELKASTNGQIHHHHKKESVQSQQNSTFFVISNNHQDLHSNEYPSNIVNHCFHNWVTRRSTGTSIRHKYNILQVKLHSNKNAWLYNATAKIAHDYLCNTVACIYIVHEYYILKSFRGQG